MWIEIYQEFNGNTILINTTRSNNVTLVDGVVKISCGATRWTLSDPAWYRAIVLAMQSVSTDLCGLGYVKYICS